jgi:NAD-dependent dihydropyrimidine dehydrogenase PreA subunit
LSNSDTWNQINTQQIKVDLERCSGCGTCKKVCPFMVYEIKTEVKGKKAAVPVYLEDCFLCQSCQAQCPMDAITIQW